MPRIELTEKWLRDCGVEYEYHPVVVLRTIAPIEQDIEQIRIHGTDPDHIEGLKTAHRNGDRLPPLVLWKSDDNGTQQLHTVDGIHREQLFKSEGVKEWDAYVVGCDLKTFSILQRTANVRHGKALSLEEKIVHAMTLIASGAMNVAQASRLFYVCETTLSNKLRVSQTRITLEKAGVRTSTLNDTSLAQLSKISNRPELQKQIALLAQKVGLDSNELFDLIKKLKACTTDLEADAFLIEQEKLYSDRSKASLGGKVKVVSPLTRTPSLLLRAENYLAQDPKLASLSKTVLQDLVKHFVSFRQLLDKKIEFLRAALKKL
jgi:hypothetical protein